MEYQDKNNKPLEENNIFSQPRFFYTLNIIEKYKNLFSFIYKLDVLELEHEYFEQDKDAPSLENLDDDLWIIKIYIQNPFEVVRTERLLRQTISKNLVISRCYIENKDWVKETQNNFKPIDIEEFYVHTNNFPDEEDKINLIINPDRAFGTGEHQTTQLCLKAISYAKRIQLSPKNCLDMGCGSGILAIALKKVFSETQVVASDMDTQSVEVSIENSKNNNCDIKTFLSNGFYHKEIRRYAPYSLIVSNILAKPIISLAQDMANNTEKNGLVILSGFVEYQTRDVLSEYIKNGFILENEFNQDSWVCLLLRKAS